MFTLTQFLATSKHYFVVDMPAKAELMAAVSTAYADLPKGSRWEELALGTVSLLAGLTVLTAVVIAV